MRTWEVYFEGQMLASYACLHFPLPHAGELIVLDGVVWEVDYLLHKPDEKKIIVQVKSK